MPTPAAVRFHQPDHSADMIGCVAATCDENARWVLAGVYYCSRCLPPAAERSYEPPVVTPVGNMHDLLAHVCAGGECDPE